MKQQLTKEHSRRLIELGISKRYASEMDVEEVVGISANHIYPIFTIGDLLEVLPKEIETDGGLRYGLNIMYDERAWRVCYLNGHSTTATVYCDELIDALFDFIIWCIGVGFILI